MDIDEDLISIMLVFAAEFGYLNIVQDIMKNGSCDPAFEENYAIRWSARGGHVDVMRYLMSLDSKYEIDPAAGDNSAIK